MWKAVSILAAIGAALSTTACDRGVNWTTPAEPHVRLPAAPGRPGVGYFELNVEQSQRSLVSVTSPRIGRIEMHETMSSGSMTSMRPIPRIKVVEDERIVFGPGGRHLMLFDLDPALRPGDQVNLTFHFEQGAPRTLAARVESAGGESH